MKVVKGHSLNPVSEEGEQPLNIVKSGNYIVWDSIDGSTTYQNHVERSIKEFGERMPISSSLKEDPSYDYSLLMGIVEDGIPRFGCCYNYVTGEKIFVDSTGDLYREGLKREGFDAKFARYVDHRYFKQKDKVMCVFKMVCLTV